METIDSVDDEDEDDEHFSILTLMAANSLINQDSQLLKKTQREVGRR